jgi:hypothetical protein
VLFHQAAVDVNLTADCLLQVVAHGLVRVQLLGEQEGVVV